MTLRTRLALVLVALVLAPLVAAAVLVLYAVPRAAADRADSLVLGARSGVTNDIAQLCDEVGTAAVVTGRMLGSTSPATATRQAVADGLADWISVVDARGVAIASAGQLPRGLVTDPWSRCEAGEAGGPAVSTELRVVVADRDDLSAVRAADAVDSAYLDDLRARLGFTADVVLLLDGVVVASTTDPTIDLTTAPDLVVCRTRRRRRGQRRRHHRCGPCLPVQASPSTSSWRRRRPAAVCWCRPCSWWPWSPSSSPSSPRSPSPATSPARSRR